MTRHVTPGNAQAIPHPVLAELIARRSLRRKIERTVTKLIAALDALDGDRDIEEENEHGGDVLDEGEESLGWPAHASQAALGITTADGDRTAPERHGRGFVRCGPDDMEPEPDEENGDERDDDFSDREPSLGSLDGHMNQCGWSGGNPGGTDLELERLK